jgi:hypothetical protein
MISRRLLGAVAASLVLSGVASAQSPQVPGKVVPAAQAPSKATPVAPSKQTPVVPSKVTPVAPSKQTPVAVTTPVTPSKQTPVAVTTPVAPSKQTPATPPKAMPQVPGK